MSWEAILAFRLVTREADRLARFHAALGFSADDERPIDAAEMALLGLAGRGWRRPLALGPARVDLDRFEHAGDPYPAGTDAAASVFQHLALVTDDVDRWWGAASGAGAAAISRAGPVTLPAAAGGVTAMKFRDPEGHPLELIRFPDADARGWNGGGMMGIDHSAISVGDVVASRGFYREAGLVEGEATVNRGSGQAALDGLDAPLVDVVPLRPDAGMPHLELLGYRRPRPAAAPSRAANDVAATRIVWRADRDALVRDPDGHLHQLVASGA